MTKRTVRTAAVLLVALAVTLVPGAKTGRFSQMPPARAATLALEWQTEVVDGSADVGKYASLAVDVEDRPLISYYDWTNSSLKVARDDGETWHFDTLDPAYVAGCQTSLALDAQGGAHVSYCGMTDDGAQRLKYAYQDGTEWHATPVGTEAATHTSLALDSAGQPHICYTTAGGLQYARREGDAWSFDTVDPAGEYCSIVDDGSGDTSVAYRDADTRSLMYAFLPSGDGAEWQVEKVGDALVRGHPSLALNTEGLPRIAYNNGLYSDLGYLEYAWKGGDFESWEIEGVDSTEGAGYHASLALDADGQPRIAYYRTPELAQLAYAHLEDTEWVVEILETGDDLGSYATLALDAAGNPHIGYRDETAGVLKYATYDLWPPVILEGPAVGPVTSNTARISWLTDEESDSLVLYGQRAGIYDLYGEDPGLLLDHSLDLTGLEPSTVYNYLVESTDASGNTVRSEEGFFTTLAEPDGEPPSVPSLTLDQSAGPFGYPVLRAPATDNVGVGRVQFTMDGKLVGTAYSRSPSGDYSFVLALPHLGLTPEEVYGDHEFGAVATDFAGLSDSYVFPDTVRTPPPDGKFDILAPDPWQKLYAPGGTTPPGTTVEIEAYASQYQEECADPFEWFSPIVPETARSVNQTTYFPTAQTPMSIRPPWCYDVERAVEWVEFYIDDVWKARSEPEDEMDLLHEYTWYASGLTPGVHAIKVVAQYSDENQTQWEKLVAVEVVETNPSIEVTRQIQRIGNYFVVQLWVQNQGTALARLYRLVDNVSGFQAIRKEPEPLGTAGEYWVTTDYVTSDRRCDVTIELEDGSGGPLPLGPGQSIIVEYLAVPIRYADSPSGQYMAGEEPVEVRYYDATSWHSLTLHRPTTTIYSSYLGKEVSLGSEVAYARGDSNYLIVSNFSRLFDYNTNPVDVNWLLSAMAELAQLKYGILGDLTVPGTQTYDAIYVRSMLDQWGEGMRGVTMEPLKHPQDGYVLLVGEEEIVPGMTLSRDDWTVNLSDLWYANTEDHWRGPERVVGRIIGEDAAKLTMPIQTSINVHQGVPDHHFDRDYALSLAGRGDGVSLFESSAWLVSWVLSLYFSDVELLYQRTVEESGHDINDEFRSSAYEQDVIFYRDHAGVGSWGDGSTVIDTGDLIGADPIDFGSTKPFVFGCACLSGNYSGVSLAEAFLQDGAGVYIGATEASNRLWNNKACLRFYTKWTDSTTRSIGKALRDTKRDITSLEVDPYEGAHWGAMYNLYGDPKYGGASAVSSELSSTETTSAEPPSTISVDVPDFEVATIDGLDYVDIPEGTMFFEVGKPLVPIYNVETEIAEGYRVQDVQLTSRSGLVSGTGLNLPLATQEWDGLGTEAATADLEAGWWPEVVFDWEVQENAGGGSTLVLRLVPFYYDPATTDFKFYKDYEFSVESSPSSVAIELLATDRAEYPQGETVLVDLWLNNSGEPQDVLFEAMIRSDATDEVVDGLPLRLLSSVEGLVTYFDQWDTTGYPPGSYIIEGVLRDTEGSILDRALAEVSLGISLMELTALTASPDAFDPGDPVRDLADLCQRRHATHLGHGEHRRPFCRGKHHRAVQRTCSGPCTRCIRPV